MSSTTSAASQQHDASASSGMSFGAAVSRLPPGGGTGSAAIVPVSQSERHRFGASMAVSYRSRDTLVGPRRLGVRFRSMRATSAPPRRIHGGIVPACDLAA